MLVRSPLPPYPLTPRLPVFGWATWSGKKSSVLPCLLDHEQLVYTTSGRASILLAMEQLGVGPGVKVLMPTYHCPTMIAPVDELGAQTVFYPVTTSGAPDMQWLARLDNRDIKVMLAAHFFGLPQPMAAIRAWCDERTAPTPCLVKAKADLSATGEMSPLAASPSFYQFLRVVVGSATDRH
jgi:perosamine synthetase